jgi:hypothetical protein
MTFFVLNDLKRNSIRCARFGTRRNGPGKVLQLLNLFDMKGYQCLLTGNRIIHRNNSYRLYLVETSGYPRQSIDPFLWERWQV